MNVNFTLRPYQTVGVDALRHAYKNGKRAPLYSLPTGGGKTLVFSYITRNAVNSGRRVLILVHRSELLRQASNTLTRWGVAHGLISPRHPMTGQMVQVASVATIVRPARLARMAPPDLIIVDEAHHTVAGTWQKIIEAFPRARLLGVTATPSRMDGRGLGVHCGGYFDALISGPSVQDLIDGGFLAKPRVFASPRHLNLDGIRTRAGDYAQEQLSRAVSNREIIGDAVAHYARICPGKPAIAFCASIAHAQMVTEQFTRGGWRARRIDGGMADGERTAIVSALAEGDLDVMTSVDLVSEGFDVPACSAAILLRPTQSEMLYLQQVGRALRIAPGKTHAYILDHAGNVARHGLPQDARAWTLDGRDQTDRGPALKQCPNCYAMLPMATRICPECENCFDLAADGDGSRSREIEQVAGELIELTPEMIAARRAEQQREVNGARSREELMRIARARGYNPRWVEHILRARDMGRRRA
jgi:superfamily II DNA or RNA helicase